MTTLISFIGRGRKDIDLDAYRKVNYDFGSIYVSSSCFLRALCASGKYKFDNVLVIGTYTSSWSTLIDDCSAGEDDLWLRLEEESTPGNHCGGVMPETLSELERALSSRWNVPVKCIAHEQALDEANAMSLLERYCTEAAQADSSVIMDITHSFRWMPMMLMASMQFKNSFPNSLTRIDIIYGEENGKVRYLDAIWKGFDLARACSIFFDKFEPEPLVALIDGFWSSGAKAISRLGRQLQGNFLVHIDESLDQLKNALTDFKNIPSPPLWSQRVHKELQSFHFRLSSSPFRCRNILALAGMFAERHLFGQAIITLRLSYEAFLFDFFKEIEYGNYKLTEKLDDRFKKSHPSFRKQAQKLDYSRNMVAHGGAESVNPHDSKPQINNLPKAYKDLSGFLIKLYKEKLE